LDIVSKRGVKNWK